MSALRHSTRLSTLKPAAPPTPVMRFKKKSHPPKLASDNPMMVETLKQIAKSDAIRHAYHNTYDPSNSIHEVIDAIFDETDALILQANDVYTDEEFKAFSQASMALHEKVMKCPAWESNQMVSVTLGIIPIYCDNATYNEFNEYDSDDTDTTSSDTRIEYRKKIIQSLNDFKNL